MENFGGKDAQNVGIRSILYGKFWGKRCWRNKEHPLCRRAGKPHSPFPIGKGTSPSLGGDLPKNPSEGDFSVKSRGMLWRICTPIGHTSSLRAAAGRAGWRWVGGFFSELGWLFAELRALCPARWGRLRIQP